jgi:hypothetical protein
MRLRNGKRGHDEAVKGFEQDKIKRQQHEEFIKRRDEGAVESPMPSSSTRSAQKPKKLTKTLKNDKITRTPAEWQAFHLERASILNKIYEKKLEDADKNSTKLWKCNGKLEKVFIKKIMELSKKEGASKRTLEKIKTNVEIYQKAENVLKLEQDRLFKKNKKLELAAKRAFINSKRAAAGEYLTEVEENTMVFRLDAKVNEEQDCAICIDKIGHNRSVMTKLCKHYFHEDCFLSWMELSSSCPMCRTGLEPAVEQLSIQTNEGGFGRIHDVMTWASTTATNTS